MLRRTLEEDITTDLYVLQSHLDGMLDRVHHNSLTLKRLQAFEMRLLGLTSLTDMVEFILGETKELFDLDVVSLCLFDPKDAFVTHLINDNYPYQTRLNLQIIKDEQLFKRHFDSSERPLLGLFNVEKYAQFFAAELTCPSSVILAPLIRRGKHLGSLNLGSYSSERFIRNMATDFIEHLASVLSICLENTLNFETLRRTSLVDPLTGVNNRRFLEQRIEEEIDRSLRTHQPLSCLFLDIDYFKRINDNFGHQAGDHVLASIACVIKKHLRSNDVLSRYGGEEFVALLSETDALRVYEIAERIRKAIAALAIKYQEAAIDVTLSIGVATFEPTTASLKTCEIAQRLIQAADTALYQAKHNGRNRVEDGGVIEGSFDNDKLAC